jgi:hypothetical protein
LLILYDLMSYLYDQILKNSVELTPETTLVGWV